MKNTKTKKINVPNIIVATIMIVLSLNLLTSKSDTFFKLVGFRTYTVLSGSMEPTYSPGDVIITKHKSKSDIKVDDIVTFIEDDSVITHRIVEQSEKGYITKGDNNNTEDTQILTPENIIGEVVFGIPKIGYMIDFLSKPMVIAVEMILLGLVVIYYVIKEDKRNKKTQINK